MTANEFLIEEINRRAEAAKALSDDIKINDVDISGGCFRDGIRVWSGIEQISALTGAEITDTANGDNRRIKSVEINGIAFFQETYVKGGDTE